VHTCPPKGGYVFLSNQSGSKVIVICLVHKVTLCMVCKSLIGVVMERYSELEVFFRIKNEAKYFVGEQIELFRKKFAKFLGCNDAMVNINNIFFDGNSFSFNLVVSVFVEVPKNEQVEETLRRTINGTYNDKKVAFIFKNVEYPVNEVDSILKLYQAIYDGLFIY